MNEMALYRYLQPVDSLPSPVVATWLFAWSARSILTVTDLEGARFARVKEEAWQSFGRSVA